MRVFMLGWEFPPYISGGLGKACHGLTRGLSEQGHKVTFVLPRSVRSETDSSVRVFSPEALASGTSTEAAAREPGFENVTFKTVPAHFHSPYQRAESRWADLDRQTAAHQAAAHQAAMRAPQSVLHEPDADVQRHARGAPKPLGPGEIYTGDLFSEADRYARLCVELAKQTPIDVVHAHDWLTFPAGMAVAAATGKPLIVHVHSTEIDRAGDQMHERIYDIERRGLHAAMRVMAVSQFTRSIIQHRYGVDADRIDVVYNGIDPAPEPEAREHLPRLGNGERIVLFLGRVTMQKGPTYFIEAAKKVLEKDDHVKFVVTGSGDQVPDVIDLAAKHNIGHRIAFTGFLEGSDLDRVFQSADVYVMPSVSEPFGLAAMEAIRHDVPTIVSRTSGVSEALRHVLKVDFWNTDEIADRILAVLKHPSLATTLRDNADRELDRFTWSEAATRCRRIYGEAIASMPD